MSADTSEGFLSPGMVAAIPFVRKRNASSFSLADEVNLLGMDALPKLKVHRDDTLRVIAATMFGRILMSYQAALVLLERGLAADAGTIVRTMGEAAIILAAVDEPDMVQRLALREAFHQRKMRTSWLADPEFRKNHTTAEEDGIQAAIDSLDQDFPEAKKLTRDPINVWDVAVSRGLSPLYNSVLRHASHDSVHTSFAGLQRHVTTDENLDIQGFKFTQSDDAEIADCLQDCVQLLLVSLQAVAGLFDVFGLQQHINAAADALSALRAASLAAD